MYSHEEDIDSAIDVFKQTIGYYQSEQVGALIRLLWLGYHECFLVFFVFFLQFRIFDLRGCEYPGLSGFISTVVVKYSEQMQTKILSLCLMRKHFSQNSHL